MDLTKFLDNDIFLEVNKDYLGNFDPIEGDSVLLYGVLKAVVEGNLEKVIHHVELGHFVNINDSNGNTPIHVAVIKDNLEILKFLLKIKHILINAQNFLGETALLLAVKLENIEAAELILAAGADVNIANYDDETVLHLAVMYPDLAHKFILNGAFLDSTDYSGDTPLHDAVAEQCMETICMLLYYNASTNIQGVNNLTPFMKALITKNVEIQATIIWYVTDFNAETFDHVSTLALALMNRTPFLEEIIEGGADVNYAYGYDMIDPFALCLQTPNPDSFRLIWNKLKYNGNDMSLGSILWRMGGTLLKDHFRQYIDIIIESDNISQAVKSLNTAEDFYMVVTKFFDFFHQHGIEQLTALTCRLLTHGYVVTSFDMTKIFQHFGYCELFKILLFMDIKEIGERPPDISMLIYQVQRPINNVLNEIVSVIRTEYLHNTIYHLLDYTIYPKLRRAYLNLRRYDSVRDKISRLPRVPSLLELSRNKSREYLVCKFCLRNSCQFYTLLNCLDIGMVYKKIIAFERPIYRPTGFCKEDTERWNNSRYLY